MSTFAIVSDSSCDLPDEIRERMGISLVRYFVSLDGVRYMREGLDISPTSFYQSLRTQKAKPKTSMPPIQDYDDVFRPVLEKGQDVLCICLTSKFSGSCQSALIAAKLLKEDFPNRDIQVLDSKQCAMGQGFLVMEAAKLRDQGFSLFETVRVLNRACAQYRLMITVDSLEYLQRGGRIGLVSAFAGTLLNIKPIIYMSDGELHPLSMARGRLKAIQALVKAMRTDIGQSADNYRIGILHADCEQDLALLQEECVKQGFKIDLPVFVIGVTIGAHIGPSALAVGYFPKTELFIEKA